MMGKIPPTYPGKKVFIACFIDYYSRLVMAVKDKVGRCLEAFIYKYE